MSVQPYRDYYNAIADRYDQLKAKNHYYHQTVNRLLKRIIPKGASVLEIGCATGDLLAALEPGQGIGIDFSEDLIHIARRKHPSYTFHCAEAENFSLETTPDYIILADVLPLLWNIQTVLANIRNCTAPHTRIILTSHSYAWQPILQLAEHLGFKPKRPRPSWLTIADMENLLRLEGFELIKAEKKVLLPVYIPLLTSFLNRYLGNLPLIQNLGLVNLLSCRVLPKEKKTGKVSIVIPARNEKGNIEAAIQRTPVFGDNQEFIFVEGGSSDGTLEEMQRVQGVYPDQKIKVLQQPGIGKGDAVRHGFAHASGDILMILDADLTTPPESLQAFYDALVTGKGDFINGCRLVYPMQKQAMRFLNFLGNKFFSMFFTYLLGQRLKDTLCGTKVLYRKDYELILANRHYFGDFDPFGDFDLLFGATRLNLRIVEVYVRYADRTYGETQISRFSHGWLLLRMSFFAARKIKFVC